MNVLSLAPAGLYTSVLSRNQVTHVPRERNPLSLQAALTLPSVMSSIVPTVIPRTITTTTTTSIVMTACNPQLTTPA